MHAESFELQIKKTCRLTGAVWGACIRFQADKSRQLASHGLIRGRAGALASFLTDPQISKWTAGGLQSGRTRSRTVAAAWPGLDCARVYLFPVPDREAALLVGAPDLGASEREFFRILALSAKSAPASSDALSGPIRLKSDPAASGRSNGGIQASLRPVVSADEFFGLLDQLMALAPAEEQMADLANRALQAISDYLDLDQAALILFDYAAQSICLAAVHGIDPEPPRLGHRIELDDAVFEELIEAAGRSAETTEGQRFDANRLLGDLIPAELRERPLVFRPLQDGAQIRGLFASPLDTSRGITEGRLAELEILLGLAAGRIGSRLYFEQQLRLQAQLQATHEASQDVAEQDLETVLRRTVQRARDLVQARGVELGLYNEKEQFVRILLSETPWNEDTSGTIIPLMTGVAGHMASSGAPLVVNDYNAWDQRVWPEKQAPFKAVAGVPLKIKGQVIGTLTVIDDDPERSFTRADVKLLEMLASQISISMRNARLFQELGERVKAQKLAENRLIQSARLAAVGEMAAGVAHELNNPLTTIAGFAELILEDLDADSTLLDELELILREARRARGVVRRLLDFSRQSESLKVPTDINEILSEVVTLVHHLARASAVEIRLEPWDDLPLIEMDHGQMKQVILNLVQNGLQAMPRGGRLLLRTSLEQQEDRSYIVVTVQDTGEGIPEDIIHQIFEPFFTTKAVGSGTGLGLSISYGIVSDHGGYIEVESEMSQGTRFLVWLPIQNEPTEAVDSGEVLLSAVEGKVDA